MASRIGGKPITVPTGVDVQLSGQNLTVKGKLGQLQQLIHADVKIKHADNSIEFAPANDAIEANALAGTMRALVNNMVTGVHEGFQRELKLVGVGYRAKAQGKVLDLTVGFSHPVKMEMPEGVTVETPSNTDVIVKGSDKQKVCQVAANIRAIRPPEPYKGKGIRYADERISLKEGKKK
ncbi:MAG: 50S ribosomal protein L6 [Gammaproteobacteria bacterium]|nr:50S ribosomal protein L6 [Gammaproteobacteria bacterium]